MPNITELLRRVESQIDDTLSAADIVAWFNGAQGALADVISIQTKKTITRDSVSGGFLMPTDLNGMLTFTLPTTVHHYDAWDGYLHIYSASDTEDTTATSITVTYNRFPVDVTASPTSIPEIEPRFHDAYVYWACMQAMNPEEEPARYAQYERDFARLKTQMRTFYGRNRIKPDRWGVDR